MWLCKAVLGLSLLHACVGRYARDISSSQAEEMEEFRKLNKGRHLMEQLMDRGKELTDEEFEKLQKYKDLNRQKDEEYEKQQEYKELNRELTDDDFEKQQAYKKLNRGNEMTDEEYSKQQEFKKQNDRDDEEYAKQQEYKKQNDRR